MALIKKYNDKPEIIANKSVIDHNQLANRDQYGAHSISAIRGLPEKLTKLKNKDIELEEKIGKQSTDLSELTEKVNEVESKASQIDIVENADSTFTFTNYNGDEKTIQSGFLPDDDTLELKDNKLALKQIHTDNSLEGKGTQEYPLLVNIDNTTIAKRADGALEAISLKTNGESISGVTIKENLDELNKDIGDLTDTLNADVARLDAYNNTQDEEIKKLQDITQGIGGYLNSYDFGKDPTQDDLTNYALQQIGITDKSEIFDGTKVINLYDSHLWRLTNTPNSTPPVFEWSDLGEVQSVSIATKETLGLVRSSDDTLKGKVNNLTGEISINGLEEKLDDKASLTEQNDFTGINNFNAETNFNEEVNVDNHNINIHNGYLATTDENKDLVTKYSADEVVIENGTGENAKVYNLKFPLRSGTLATTDDVPEVDIDNETITKTSDSKLQSVGVKYNDNLITAEMIYNATHYIKYEDDPAFSRTLSENSFATISQISRNEISKMTETGDALYTAIEEKYGWKVGDTIQYKITGDTSNTGTYTAQIWDFNNSVDKDSNKNGILFGNVELLKVNTSMANTNVGGFGVTTAATQYLPTVVYENLQDDLKAVIRETKVTYHSGVDDPDTELSGYYKLYLPSEYEMLGTTTYAYQEGQYLKYWQEHTTDADRIKKQVLSNAAYWLRTANKLSSKFFTYISSSGALDATKYPTLGFAPVCPMFSI